MSEHNIVIINSFYLAPDNLQLGIVPDDMSTNFDIRPLLKEKKTYKYLSKQDQLALYSAIKAVDGADISTEELNWRTGIYFTVGVIPFEDRALKRLAGKCQKEGQYDSQRFSTDGLQSINPLMIFKGLPNMPVFHISYHLNIYHTYLVNYPGGGQWGMSFKKAMEDLKNKVVDYALVGVVADQRNKLVKYHNYKMDRNPNLLVDSSTVLILSRFQEKFSTCPRIEDLKISYHPVDLFQQSPDYFEKYKQEGFYQYAVDLGPCELAMDLCQRIEAKKKGKDRFTREYQDGIKVDLGVNFYE